MDLKEIITFFVICITVNANIVSTLPTFGNEFIHINVHIPSEPSSTKTVLKAKPPLVHQKPAFASHKVIHHYYRRRKPTKKISIEESVPTLENLYLSELRNHHPVSYSHHDEHGHHHTEETFVVKALHDSHYHHLEKPKANVNTFKIIEKYEDDHHLNHKEQGKAPIESVKFIETSDDHHQNHHHQNENPNIETVKLIESSDGHNHQHHYYLTGQHNPLKGYGLTAIETTKLIETTDKHHHPHHYHVHNAYSHIQPPKSDTKSDHYVHYQKPIEEEHIYHKPQADALDIVKTIATIPKDNYKNYETKNHYLVPELIEETLDIFATKKTKIHNYEVPAYQYQQPQQETAAHYHHETPSTHYDYKPKQEISIDELIEHKRPQSHVQTNYPHVTPVTEKIPHHYSSSEGNYDSTHVEHTDVAYETQNKPPANYRQYLPPSETPPNFEQSQVAPQTAINEDIQPGDINAKEDSAHAVENPRGPETYTGYDSYSAGHVQGVNSGGYSQHPP